MRQSRVLRRTLFALAAVTSTAVVIPDSAASAAGREGSGVSLKVITFGEERQRLQSTPIEQRPYRPLHVYGNAVRRQHSRGQSFSPSSGAPAARSAGQRTAPRTSS